MNATDREIRERDKLPEQKQPVEILTGQEKRRLRRKNQTSW